MKLTGETEGLALVLDTALLKARRWSRLKVSRPPTFLTCVRLAHTLWHCKACMRYARGYWMMMIMMKIIRYLRL
eukprot:COSAG01_NODE_58_length_30193_cov_12.302020_20_plen_74_part_00